jgi:hypothetical protein
MSTPGIPSCVESSIAAKKSPIIYPSTFSPTIKSGSGDKAAHYCREGFAVSTK